MDNRTYLAILASGALFAVGVAGCDAGDPGDPATPEPESSAMYDTDDTTDDMDRTTDTMADRETQAQERMQQTEEDTWQTQQQQAGQQQDPSYANTQSQGSAVGDLSTLGQEEVVGKSVVSQQGEEIGQIEEVVMDTESQQQLAVIDVGGFLGIGEKSVAVSFDQLQLSEDGRVRSDLTRDTLESQPEYDPAQFGEAQEPM